MPETRVVNDLPFQLELLQQIHSATVMSFKPVAESIIIILKDKNLVARRPIIKDDTSESNQILVREYDGKTSFKSYVMRISKTINEANFDQESTYFS